MGNEASTIDARTLDQRVLTAAGATTTTASRGDAQSDSAERRAPRERLIAALVDAVAAGSVARLGESR